MAYGVLLVFLLKALKTSNYGSEPMLRNCGIAISTGFTQVEGRVLPAPRVYIHTYMHFFIVKAIFSFIN